tara:strand:+ start:2343 stop:4820 length:2478 start_codon:yes stop_codon:yes gene_type:complete
MAKILDEYKPIVTQGRKIVSALGIDLSTHNHAEHLQKLADKTLEGSLNVRDVMYLTLANKGLKIPKESEGFVADSNLKFLRESFPFNPNAPFAPTGTGPSPQPNTFMQDWTELTNQLKKNNESLDTLWKDVATPEAQTKYDLSKEFSEPPGRAKALRQGAFAIDTQAALIGASEIPSDVKDATTGRRLYLDDRGLTSILGGSRVFTQKKRLEGKGLAVDYGPENVKQTFSAFQQGLQNVDNKDVKAAILLNSIIPFRAKNITNLRMNEAPGGQYAYLSEDGSTIKIPEEGQKVGQKRYVDVKLTPHLQAVLTEIRDANTDANGNPTREYLFRPKGQKADAFNKEVGKALKGVAEATKSMADEGILGRPITDFKDLRKISYLNMVVMPGNTGLALSNIAGHSTKLSDAKLTQQFGITSVGVRAYAGRGARKTIEKPVTPTELIQLVERNIVEGAGLRDRRDISSVIFNVPFELKGYTDRFTDPAITETQGRDLAKNVLQEVEFETQLNNRPDLSFESKLWIIENLKTPEAFKAFEDQIEQAQKAVGSESVDSLDQIIQRKINPELKVDSSVQEVIKELETPEAPSKPSVMPEPVVTSPESDFDFTDTPQEDIPQTAQDARRQASEFFEDEQQKRDIFRRTGKGLTKLGLGALFGGGAGFLATTADAAIDVALSPTEIGYGGLDPTEEIMGTPTSDISDTKLLERMQAASSQRLSPDMAERTTALADIEANREGLAARAFDAPSRMRAEQADLTELDYTTPELERMRLAETLQDVDTSEAFTEQARKARIAAEAAQLFNKGGEDEGEPSPIDIYNTFGDTPLEERFK